MQGDQKRKLECNNVKFPGYGMTECVMGTHLPVLNVKDPHLGVGKAVSNLQQKMRKSFWIGIYSVFQFVDVSTGKEVGVGERGEVLKYHFESKQILILKLWVKSPILMIGYLNRPEATAETIDKDGWLHTGMTHRNFESIFIIQVTSAILMQKVEHTLLIDWKSWSKWRDTR